MPAADTRDRRESFEAEALPHLDAVYRFALRLTGSPGEAEDLVQETYLRAFRAWDQYTPGTRARSWLFTICRNAFLRERERDIRRDELVAEAAHVDSGGAVAGDERPLFAGGADYDPEGDYFRGIVDDRVLAAIDGLPVDFREAVVLSDLQGLSYQEIADVVGVPVGTVKSRLFRGRKILQRQLYEFARESGYIGERDG
ncbi:MAG TPA: sigma-70 family RNA polymerase sigma factor [Longimicrobiales bacterium]|nr:sigma-70 family RNA polymerase sigma factor [Longimicrobiales bacterium]